MSRFRNYRRCKKWKRLLVRSKGRKLTHAELVQLKNIPAKWMVNTFFDSLAPPRFTSRQCIDRIVKIIKPCFRRVEGRFDEQTYAWLIRCEWLALGNRAGTQLYLDDKCLATMRFQDSFCDSEAARLTREKRYFNERHGA